MSFPDIPSNFMGPYQIRKQHDGTELVFLKGNHTMGAYDLTSLVLRQKIEQKIAEHHAEIATWELLLMKIKDAENA